MDVREKLVELIAETIELYPSEREELADGLIANGVTVQEWIPVTERLPEDGVSVMTCKNGIVEVQVYEKRRNGWIQGNWFWSMATVTHWMPLPAQPKGE